MRLSTLIDMSLISLVLPKATRWSAHKMLHAGFSTVGYITDVEGDLGFWKKNLQSSTVLQQSEPHDLISLKEDSKFVFGGDVCDRGTGSVRVMKDLTSLKERYPDRVNIILGNRDINKLRLTSSMHRDVLRSTPHTYWVKTTPTGFVADGFEIDNPESKMKWILGKTMGAPHAYELRQQELNEMGDHVNAQAPWRSILLAMCPKEGTMTRYLELGQLAVRKADVLFVHGAVHEHNMRWVPPSYEDVCRHQRQGPSHHRSHAVSPLLAAGRYVDTVDEWIAGLNAFVAAEMADYRQRTEEYLRSLSADHPGQAVDKIWESVGGYAHPQPGSRLLQYGMGRLPDGAHNPSVVYASYMRQRPGTPTTPGGPRPMITEMAPMSAATAQWLRSNGVRTVVVGHQPVGDVPLYMETHGVQVLSVDTAYSNNVQYPRSQLSGPHTYGTTGKEEWRTQAQVDAERGLKHDHWATASTRSPRAVFEVLFRFPAERRDAAESSVSENVHRQAGAATIDVEGTLSTGHAFRCRYKCADDKDNSTATKDPFLGRTTEAGWTVRAHGVEVAAPSDKSETPLLQAEDGSPRVGMTAWKGGAGGDHYVLSKVEGYTFRNRLVHRDDMGKEFP